MGSRSHNNTNHCLNKSERQKITTCHVQLQIHYLSRPTTRTTTIATIVVKIKHKNQHARRFNGKTQETIFHSKANVHSQHLIIPTRSCQVSELTDMSTGLPSNFSPQSMLDFDFFALRSHFADKIKLTRLRLNNFAEKQRF